MHDSLVDKMLEGILEDVDSSFIKAVKAANGEKGGALLDTIAMYEKASKVAGKDPNAPAAFSLPFQELPEAVYIKGPKYKVTFDKMDLHKDEGSWGQSAINAVAKEGVLDAKGLQKLIEDFKAKHQNESLYQQHIHGHTPFEPGSHFQPLLEQTVSAGAKSHLLEDVYIEKPKAQMLEFFAYETMGASIGHMGALAKADFGEGDGSWGHALMATHGPNGGLVFQNSWGNANIGFKTKNSWGPDTEAVDAPVAVIECEGKVTYLPDLAPVSLGRRPRGLILG